MTHFLHFGCWNEGNCNDDTDLQKTMMKLQTHIKNNINENKINFIVVAGDNYYPDKNNINEKKIKNINTINFLSGIKCLLNSIKQEDIEKYILLGNHEYDNIKNIDNIDYDFMQCYIMKQQKNIFEDIPNTHFFMDVMEKKINKTLILFIDTTIYEEIEEMKIVNSCFTHIFPSANPRNTISDLCNYQEKKVLEILDKNQDIVNLIIISHHPLVSVKYKEKKEKKINEQTHLYGLINLYKKIYNKIINKDVNLYHLCADTHIYQYGIINIIMDDNMNKKITQYICGTGGAHKDKCNRNDEILFKNSSEDITYTIYECMEVNGFLDVEISDDNPVIFKFIMTNNYSDKYMNKYIKYKKKYLYLKKF